VKERIADKTFEFANGSLIEFRSADEPDSLRGAGLDILWMDEAAFIRSDDAYRVVRPAMADKQGIVINTTTPDRQNWFFDRFWSGKALDNPRHFRVSYWSLDNPHFPVDEWEEERADTHPMIFAQEYMASFDAMKGNSLAAEWLHYYSDEDIDGLDLEKYIGIDPAISQNPKADRFVLSVIGVHRRSGQVFLLDQYADHIPFPEQVETINRYWLENQPCMGVGVETVAYQAALAQQVLRLDDFIPILPMEARGKKFERILSMSPLFRAKRVLIRRSHTDFIQEWLDYDVEEKHPHDDCLDSVEIALRTAGVLLTPPIEREEPVDNNVLVRTMSSQEAADRRYQRLRETTTSGEDRWKEFDSAL
jgi:predicted phage terminase large subunit-like protein